MRRPLSTHYALQAETHACFFEQFVVHVTELKAFSLGKERNAFHPSYYRPESKLSLKAVPSI